MSKQSCSWLAILATVDCSQSSSVATSSTVWVMVLGLKALLSLLRLGLDDITPKGFPQGDRPRRDSYAISNKTRFAIFLGGEKNLVFRNVVFFVFFFVMEYDP